uniref:DUF3700 domain-containing protein n=2 Tax=Dunaliella tertiolecta TaxID=3047 RepID=A0A7S3QLZ7_DUNTE|mmetsp:Transcript_4669/g.12778  ORF Transcript_4669/g.12778 Transcript_4669/m.12778 type:complete len:273 (+) Transcript_4669:76-894(+)|eukprot:CAMPEP_0202372378 /NCGR_PEP_ID=MMETSP1127-20130417/3589_1 /ASSEMBLY_ACC=CAM_ASM_000462 /TAXON_ID=3047 /ORGANISM="Dunaliella tertiolecta, Strain CCMP1320" /LENGTH=272 /DNA_ID=CAMNT_0048968903 /DNA_START=93 /DNA_END=911 /DNA_ORIENTATION=-
MHFLAAFSHDEASFVCPFCPSTSPTTAAGQYQCACAPNKKEEKMVNLEKARLQYHEDTYTSYATDGEVHVILVGEVASWPGIDVVKSNHDAYMRGQAPVEPDDAHWLLDFYRTFDAPGSRSDEVLDLALQSLEQVRGSFAFVIYDRLHHRVLAARDRDGVIPLYWGTDEAGQLKFGSELADFADCNPSATLFPAGAMFTSALNRAESDGPQGWVISGEGMPGQLLSFLPADTDNQHYRGIRAIPRITSQGVLCGAIFKVASNADLAHPVLQL